MNYIGVALDRLFFKSRWLGWRYVRDSTIIEPSIYLSSERIIRSDCNLVRNRRTNDRVYPAIDFSRNKRG